jgi:hypothetical protein
MMTMMTNRRRIWDRNANPAVAVLVAMAAMAGCTALPQARSVPSQEAGGSNAPANPDAERGIHIERERLGFDHTLQVRRSKSGVPHELHDGDAVWGGERLHASILTSEDAYLYLAFCTKQGLSVYPSPGGIRTRAGESLLVPQAGEELVFDGDPGPEVLYVILSRTELSHADPHLAQALAAKRPGNAPVDCGPSLNAQLAKPSSTAGTAVPPAPGSTGVVRGEVVAKKPLPLTRARDGHGPSSSASAKASRRRAGSSGAVYPASPPPDPDFERNPGDIVWYSVDTATGPVDVVAADDAGIAVVRHAFTHVAQASP